MVDDGAGPGPLSGADWERVKAEAAARAAELMAAMMRPGRELAEAGRFPVTVAHGVPEDDEESARVFGLAEVAQQCARRAGDGCRVDTVGRSDAQTFVFGGPGAQRAAQEFAAAAAERASSWWRVVESAHLHRRDG
jgi:hypothetical protein